MMRICLVIMKVFWDEISFLDFAGSDLDREVIRVGFDRKTKGFGLSLM